MVGRIQLDIKQKYLEEEGRIVEGQPLVRYVVGLSKKGNLYIRRVNSITRHTYIYMCMGMIGKFWVVF
jgi:hypothetical protein